MKVKILRSTVANGKDVQAGRVCDVSKHEARILFMLGKAEPAPAKADAKAKAKAKAAAETAGK